ncbi:VOC family protein [Rhodococcus sp. X156]|uniref:VOC family protein n=1 Tax=Rhodococcus sp. X156 TaxID=2499145 RepID=UPI000FD6C605|nr:VOC family protein [Rhodococcus sp. X156]
MSLVSGPIFQICWVVEDLEAAEQWFTDTLGVPHWMRVPNVVFGPEHATYRGEPADFVIDVALGYFGEQQVELIRPVSGPSLYTEHLQTSGPGLHHVAWVPEDFDAALEQARAQGLTVTQSGTFPGTGMEFAYLDGTAGGAPHVELLRLSPDMVALFDSVRHPG